MSWALMEKLAAEGWLARFTALGARLEEAIHTYRELRFEVKTVPFREIRGSDCTVCSDSESDDTVLILTRKSTQPPSDHG